MGSCRKATRPASVSPTVRSVVPTGRLMNGSLMLTARWPRAGRPAGRSDPAVAVAAGTVPRSAAAVDPSGPVTAADPPPEAGQRAAADPPPAAGPEWPPVPAPPAGEAVSRGTEPPADPPWPRPGAGSGRPPPPGHRAGCPVR